MVINSEKKSLCFSFSVELCKVINAEKEKRKKVQQYVSQLVCLWKVIMVCSLCVCVYIVLVIVIIRDRTLWLWEIRLL